MKGIVMVECLDWRGRPASNHPMSGGRWRMRKILAGIACFIALLTIPTSGRAEDKPLGYASLVEGVLEYPGLNAEGGVYWDALYSGEMALGASSALFTFGKAVDLRLGYIRHDPKIWGGISSWESTILALGAKAETFGLKPVQVMQGTSFNLWVGKNFFQNESPTIKENPWRGGFNLTHKF